MIKINLDKPLLNSDGTEHEQKITLGKALSQLLETEGEGNAIKLYSWAKKLVKTNQLELDEPDFNTLKTLVESTKRQVVLLKAQILETIIDAKDKKDSEDKKDLEDKG